MAGVPVEVGVVRLSADQFRPVLHSGEDHVETWVTGDGVAS